MRLLGILLVLASTAAAADDAALRRCRAVADAAARLACYDAIALSPEGARPARAAMPRETPELFGMENVARPDRLEAIETRIPGRFEGWRAGERIRLANGQVWQVADDSRTYLDLENPKAWVRRGALGAYYLEIEGTNRSPRVQRVQ